MSSRFDISALPSIRSGALRALCNANPDQHPIDVLVGLRGTLDLEDAQIIIACGAKLHEPRVTAVIDGIIQDPEMMPQCVPPPPGSFEDDDLLLDPDASSFSS